MVLGITALTLPLVYGLCAIIFEICFVWVLSEADGGRKRGKESQPQFFEEFMSQGKKDSGTHWH